MRRRNDDLFVSVMAGILVLFSIYSLILYLGKWAWLMFGIVLTVIGYSQFKQRTAPCEHGTKGAKKTPDACARCREEETARTREREEQRIVQETNMRRDRKIAYQDHLKKIRIPSYLRDMDPKEFENLVCELCTRMGYTVEHTPYSGDHGADGILTKSGEKTILQAKRFQGAVGEPVLRDLYGTMHSFQAKNGLLVTTGNLSQQGRSWIGDKPIRVIELDELVSLINRNFPETEVVPSSFQVPEKHSRFCPKCHRPLRKRTGKYGQFLGCSGYPSCRYTRDIRLRR